MPPVFYKRGWVADTPSEVLQNALDRAGNSAPGESSGGGPPAEEVDDDLPGWRCIGSRWVLGLPAPDASGIQLDASVQALRLVLEGASLDLPWPRPVTQNEVDSLEAKFSKKTCELRVVLPLAAEEEATPSTLLPASQRRPTEPAPSALVAPVAPVEAKDKKLTKEEIETKVLEYMRPKTSSSTPTGKVASGYADEPDMAVLMLHSAASNGDAARVRALLESSADPDGADERGSSALEKACLSGCFAAAELLIARGARAKGLPGAPSTPLHRALSMGERPGGEKLVQLLLDHHANPQIKDATGRSAVDVARELRWPWLLLKPAAS